MLAFYPMINFLGRRCLVVWFADLLRQTQDARANLPKARE
jgi:hypothetical protein